MAAAPRAFHQPEAEPTFRISGVSGASAGQTLMSIWQETPPSQTTVAFSGGDARELTVWGASLPGDLAVADRLLRSAEGQLAGVDQALAQAASQLASETAFDASGGPGLDWRRLLTELQTSVARLQGGLMFDGMVETEVDGVLVGRTFVLWLGDQRTVWREDCSTDHAALHQRTVALAVSSRTAALKTLTATVRLALRLSLPGGPVLALPSLVRLVRTLSS